MPARQLLLIENACFHLVLVRRPSNPVPIATLAGTSDVTQSPANSKFTINASDLLPKGHHLTAATSRQFMAEWRQST
jgi:hypothetical protein